MFGGNQSKTLKKKPRAQRATLKHDKNNQTQNKRILKSNVCEPLYNRKNIWHDSKSPQYIELNLELDLNLLFQIDELDC